MSDRLVWLFVHPLPQDLGSHSALNEIMGFRVVVQSGQDLDEAQAEYGWGSARSAG